MGLTVRINAIITDYERGIINAVETDYPYWTHYGCYFHYTKALYRKVQELGLSVDYRRNRLLKFFFRKIMSLPFIPEREIESCMEQFLADPQTVFNVQQFPVLADFLRYYHRTWFMTFPPKMWNVYQRSPRLRTTNDCESWNKSWNVRARRSTPNFWLAVRFLKQQERITRNKVDLANRGKPAPAQKRKWRLQNERLEAVKSSLVFGRISIQTYWNTASHICNNE